MYIEVLDCRSSYVPSFRWPRILGNEIFGALSCEKTPLSLPPFLGGIFGSNSSCLCLFNSVGGGTKWTTRPDLTPSRGQIKPSKDELNTSSPVCSTVCSKYKGRSDARRTWPTAAHLTPRSGQTARRALVHSVVASHARQLSPAAAPDCPAPVIISAARGTAPVLCYICL